MLLLPCAAVDGGGSNWPLRGGKKYLFEGGVKIRGLVYSASNAIVPAVRRGAVYSNLMHLVDIMPTLLLGVLALKETEDHGLIDIDGISHWAYLCGHIDGAPRDEVLLNIDYLDADLEYLGYFRAGIISCAAPPLSDYLPVNNSATTLLPHVLPSQSTGTGMTCFKGLFNVEEVPICGVAYDMPLHPPSLPHTGFLVRRASGSLHYGVT